MQESQSPDISEDPTIPDAVFTELQTEPVLELAAEPPKTRLLVPGKTNNRAYRRAERTFKRKQKSAIMKAARIAVKKQAAVLPVSVTSGALLQEPEESATSPTPPEQELDT